MRSFVFFITLIISVCSATAQTNVTSLVKNFSFESGLASWDNDGFQAQNNTAFTKKAGEWYAEKWTQSGGNVADASLSQTVSGLTAGVYTLQVRAQNIQEANVAQVCSGVELFIGDQTIAVSQTDNYTLSCTIINSSAEIGIRCRNATGNWVAADHFQLFYQFDSEKVDALIQKMIEQAESLKATMPSDGDELTQLNSAVSGLTGLIGTTNANEITKAADILEEAMWNYKLAGVSRENPIDFTGYLKNPDFEHGMENWTNNGFQAQGNSAFQIKEGSVYAEAWTSVGKRLGNVSLIQNVANLPKGRYILKARAHHINEGQPGIPQKGVSLIAEAEKITVDNSKSYEIEFVTIENTLRLGIQADNPTGNWIAVDNFQLVLVEYGGNIAQDEMNRRITFARSLADKRMNSATLNTLVNYADKAENSTDGNFATNAALLRVAITAAQRSADAYESLENTIQLANNYVQDGWEKETDVFYDAVEMATEYYDDLTATPEQLLDQVEKLQGAMLALKLANGTGNPPIVTTDHRYARGNNRIFARMTVSGSNIIEEGFCYSSANALPTVADKRANRWLDSGGRIYVIEDLQPGTIYYIRAYAITNTDNVGYGDVVKAVTIPMSNITWFYENNGNADENARVNAGMSGWYEYWSQLTSINGYHPSVRIASGTPTADCSYGGWCQVGTNAGFQQQATLTHEMLHGIGVGTHNVWWGGGGLRANGNRGVWLGERVTNVLTFWHNAYTVLDGDDTHMWPWGFNYASEDPHTEAGYTINALVAQALGEDGLPPTGTTATAYYAFEQEDNRKYYLTNEDVNHGLGTALLAIAPNGTLKWRTIDAGEALENDSVAWYISFNPALHKYSFKNAANGQYIVYDANFKPQTATNVPANGYFQLMRGRVDATIRNENGNITDRGYWIIFPEAHYDSPCLAAIDNGALRTEGFDLGNWAVTQRWLILNTDHMRHLAPAKTNNLTVLSELKVNNEPIPEFQTDRLEYDYEIDPTSLLTRYSIGFTKATGFNGTVRTARPQTIPGDGTAVVTHEDGNTTTYTIHFFKNHVIHWDGDGAVGAGSEPFRFGWGPRIHVDWAMANGALKNAYIDPYEGNYVGYTYEQTGYPYNYRRIIQLGYVDGNEEYNYSFKTLMPEQTYRFSALISMADAVRIPNVTIGVRNKFTEEVLMEKVFTPSTIKKQMGKVEFYFTTNENDSGDTVYQLYFKVNRAECTLSLGELVVTPVDTPSEVNVIYDDDNSLDYNAPVFDITGRKVADNVKKLRDIQQEIPRGVYIIGNKKIILQ